MEQVVKMVAERAGIAEDKARLAVDVVVTYLKGQVPAPLAGQIDSALSGGMAAAATQGLGQMLGDTKLGPKLTGL